jgi:hypothetical protein
MTNIRKDSYVKASNGVFGKVVKMNVKAGHVVVVDRNSNEVVVPTSYEFTKISTKEYNTLLTESKSVEIENSVTANRPVSKQAIAFDTFLNFHRANPGNRRTNRSKILDLFMSQCGLTQRGAETYYYNANKLFNDELNRIHGS